MAPEGDSGGGRETATLRTSEGDIQIRLFSQYAPKTVANFIGLADGSKEYASRMHAAETPDHFTTDRSSTV